MEWSRKKKRKQRFLKGRQGGSRGWCVRKGVGAGILLRTMVY